MDKLSDYIQKQYGNNPRWFEDECNSAYHVNRISHVISNRDYLSGRHKVLNRQDSQYKGKVLVTRKTILQYAKTVLRFHNAYLLGKQVQLSTKDNNTLKTLTDIYRLGDYSTVDYEILDHVNKYGDAYEAIYVEDGVIRSKVLDNASAYPVYDDMGGNYVSFIENWTDAFTNITYWNVYYPTYVEHWTNEGGEENLLGTDRCVGLPIHYHNFNDEDENFGRAFLDDIIPIMDELEDIMSKMGDAIYTNTLNVLPVGNCQDSCQ